MQTPFKAAVRVAANSLAAVIILLCAVTASGGADNFNILRQLNAEVERLSFAGEFPKALDAANQYEAEARRALGDKSIETARAISWKAFIVQAMGKSDDAIPLFEQALEIYKSVLPEQNAELATAINNLGVQYLVTNRHAEAAKLFKRALEIREKVLPPGHLEIAATLGNLAKTYNGVEHLAEQQMLLKRCYEMVEANLGQANNTLRAAVRQNYAASLELSGKFKDAEKLIREALDIRRASQPPAHPEITGVTAKLAGNLFLQGRYDEAAKLFDEALARRIKTEGWDHPDTIDTLRDMAQNCIAGKRYSEAREKLEKAGAIAVKIYPANHRDIARVKSELAELASIEKRNKDAHALAREASNIYSERNDTGLSSKEHYLKHIHYAWSEATESGQADPEYATIDETFDVAQRAEFSKTASSVSGMTARIGTSEPGLRVTIRQRQDLERQQAIAEDALAKYLAQSDTAGELVVKIRASLETLDTQIHDIDEKIDKGFPEYFSLINPKPSSVATLRSQLTDDEALVSFLVSDADVFVWAISKTDAAWARATLDPNDIAKSVTRLRKSLDSKDMRELFDLHTSFALYDALFSKVEHVVKSKEKLLVVPSGPLTSLPFHLLVTSEPGAMANTASPLEAYRQAPWLVRRHAITVLPSVQSLAALRGIAKPSGERQPLIGFGNPKFGSINLAALDSKTKTRGYNDVQTDGGGEIDIATLRNGLAPLPDAEDELRDVAKELQSDERYVLLGSAATKAALTQQPLANFKVVYFATHGLIAGELKGLGEPALVLSIPEAATSARDGLLTASEVSDLKLDSDIVVLSACNTAAGDVPGAEALSGLARAFFYAGARSLLVSHWRIDSGATTQLTTSMFHILKSNADIGYAEALRRAMLGLIADTANPLNAYPGRWAPFVVVGDVGHP